MSQVTIPIGDADRELVDGRGHEALESAHAVVGREIRQADVSPLLDVTSTGGGCKAAVGPGGPIDHGSGQTEGTPVSAQGVAVRFLPGKDLPRVALDPKAIFRALMAPMAA